MGQFTKDEVLTMRVHPSVKRKAKKIPYSYAEIFEIGCDKLYKEINLLEYQKGELELDIGNLEKEIHDKKAHLLAINNRIRIINPRRLDKETLDSLINESAKDYARELFNSRGSDSLMVIDSDYAQKAVFGHARECGYDGSKYLRLVKDYLKKLCNTDL
ncbi:hypothetical protein [uncultured Methanobrevibacter sp.]|uniref:hypothetical protein n=1 Tax=uncultured Methanobrevibacter sp. TaxID=253161 RepID=UPI0025DEC978|nr:hypothetical protein [uncultured Methanobrevibacter sp.]